MTLDRLPLAIGAGVVGWCLGWLSAWFSDWIAVADESPAQARRWGPAWLVRDPLVQGGAALVWAAGPLVLPGDWLRWAEAGLLGLPLIQVAVTDLRTRYVYTLTAAVGLALGIAFGWHFHGVDWRSGVESSLIGAAGGALAFGALYGLGRLLYRGVEPIARGDITIAAMVGAGAAASTAQAVILGILFSGLIASGVLAVMFASALLRQIRRGQPLGLRSVWVAAALALRGAHRSYIPYGPGLCLGGLVTLFWS